MNRLFFRPEQCGMTKTDAAAQTLSAYGDGPRWAGALQAGTFPA